ncbi:MAG TPA: hypothetical protein VMN58_08300 [Acidimicrobiales bacterium]|nr:hypothetical protein [Acidimicrobiales bacterium]
MHRSPCERWGRPAGVALVAVLFAGACVAQDPPGVAVDSVEANLVFGVGDLTDAVPPNFGASPPPPPVSEGPAQTDGRGFPDEPARTFPSNSRSVIDRLPATRADRPSCPPAAREDFPEEQAGINVVSAPTEGISRWKREGTRTVVNPIDGSTSEIPVDGFERRTVSEVEVIEADAESGEPIILEYVTAQPDVTANRAVTVQTFRVRTNNPPQRVQQTELAGDSQRSAVRPDSGLQLVKIETFDARTGNLRGTFEPSPAISYLPLRVNPGESYTVAGFDARTGASLTHEATVVGRERVDACGDVIDGWRVRATQTYTGSISARRTYDYIVATQFGGVIISETIETTTEDGGSISMTTSLGQLTPDPLPEDDS